MKETRRKPQMKAEDGMNTKASMNDRYLFTVVLFSFINVAQGLGVGVIGPVIAVFASLTFSVDYTFIGILFAIGFGVASIIVQIPGSKCSDLFDRRKVMFVTFLASSPFFLLFAYSRNPLELILFMFLSNAILNFPWAAFQTLMMEATPPAKWGLVNGVSATTFWMGLMMGNALSGILWDGWGTHAPFYASAFAIAASAFMPLLLKETRPKKERS
jgi:MFS family permease